MYISCTCNVLIYNVVSVNIKIVNKVFELKKIGQLSLSTPVRDVVSALQYLSCLSLESNGKLPNL